MKKQFIIYAFIATMLATPIFWSCSEEAEDVLYDGQEFPTLASGRKTRAAEGSVYIDYTDCPILPGSDTVTIGDYVKVNVVLSWSGGFIKRSINTDEGYSYVSACEAWVEGPITGSAAVNYCDVAWDGSTSHLVGTIGVEGYYTPNGHASGEYHYDFERFIDFPTGNIEIDTTQIY